MVACQVGVSEIISFLLQSAVYPQSLYEDDDAMQETNMIMNNCVFIEFGDINENTYNKLNKVLLKFEF